MSYNFEPIANTSRSIIVFDALKDAIFSGQLSPGTPLKELHLAKEFDVSQSTIREALMMLEKYGLALKKPHKGTSVIKLSEKEIKERIIVRFHLEELACIAAAKNMNKKDFQTLSEKEKAIKDAVKKNAYFELIQNDLDFHRIIWRAANNDLLYNTLDQITVPLFAAISIQRSRESIILEHVVNSHNLIVNAIKSKDLNIIKKMIREDAKESYGIFIPE
jgi:DNA-binding GntR family transcriptional regulator